MQAELRMRPLGITILPSEYMEGPISIGFPLGGDRANEDFSKAGSQALERNDLAAGSVQVEGRFSGGSWGWVGLTWNKFKAIYILSINVLDGSSRCTMMHFFLSHET